METPQSTKDLDERILSEIASAHNGVHATAVKIRTIIMKIAPDYFLQERLGENHKNRLVGKIIYAPENIRDLVRGCACELFQL